MDREKTLAALAHVDLERQAHPGAPLARLVDDAARRFDLDPAQSEWLLRMVLQARSEAPSECSTCGGALQPAVGVDGHLVCGSGHLVSARPSA